MYNEFNLIELETVIMYFLTNNLNGKVGDESYTVHPGKSYSAYGIFWFSMYITVLVSKVETFLC